MVPKIGLNVCEPAANSGTLVLPTVTAPAAADPLDQQLVALGDVVGISGDPNVVRQPATVVGVLERERQPVQRADRVAGGERRVGGRRALPGPLRVEARRSR